MAEEILRSGRGLTSIGDIVHNPQVMAGLKARGLRVVSSPAAAGPGDFIIRSHGLPPRVVRALRRRGVVIHDAACPSVRKLQLLVADLDRKGFSVIIIGNRDHPEVKACAGFGRRVVVAAPGRCITLPARASSVAVVGQTTLSFDEYAGSVRHVIDKLHVAELRVFNTICRVTEQRQAASRRLSGKVQAVLVLGGRNSANTKKLCEVCRAVNPRTYHVESLADVAAVPLGNIRRVGLTSGTSTSEEFIRSVADYFKKKGYEEVREHDE